MNILANMKIGKKMALVLAGSVLQLSCMAGLALWGFYSINAAMSASAHEARMALLAERVSGDVVGVCLRIGNMVIARRASGADEARIAALRKDYLSAIEELRSLV